VPIYRYQFLTVYR